jgi:hypothetical protein
MLYREAMAPTDASRDPWANPKERHTGASGRQDVLADALAEGLVSKTTAPAAERPSGAEGATFFPPVAGSARRRPWVPRSGTDRRAQPRDGAAGPDGTDRRAQRGGIEDEQIAVSEAGVAVLRSERARGAVHTRERRHGAAAGHVELRAGRHDLSAAVRRVAERADVVRRQLASAPWGTEVPVRPMLCLTGDEWDVPAPLMIDGVWVGTPDLVAEAMAAEPVLEPGRVDEVRHLLADGPAR